MIAKIEGGRLAAATPILLAILLAGCVAAGPTPSFDDPGECLTLDRWASRAAYEAFRARRGGEYRRLDGRSEELTEEETFLGAFEALP